MNCPQCNSRLRKVSVAVEGSTKKAVSFQCRSCDYFEFEHSSAGKVLEELRESPLKIRQKIVNISGNRLGTYFNQNLVRSLDLHSGDEIDVSVPRKGRIIIDVVG